MIKPFYTIIENQLNSQGNYGVLAEHFYDLEGFAPTENRAVSRFYTICAAAALSEIPFHEVWLLHSEQGVIDHKRWDRRVEESEPSEESTEE